MKLRKIGLDEGSEPLYATFMGNISNLYYYFNILMYENNGYFLGVWFSMVQPVAFTSLSPYFIFNLNLELPVLDPAQLLGHAPAQF